MEKKNHDLPPHSSVLSHIWKSQKPHWTGGTPFTQKCKTGPSPFLYHKSSWQSTAHERVPYSYERGMLLENRYTTALKALGFLHISDQRIQASHKYLKPALSEEEMHWAVTGSRFLFHFHRDESFFSEFEVLDQTSSQYHRSSKQHPRKKKYNTVACRTVMSFPCSFFQDLSEDASRGREMYYCGLQGLLSGYSTQKQDSEHTQIYDEVSPRELATMSREESLSIWKLKKNKSIISAKGGKSN